MDSKFIELHDTDESELISVNVKNICVFNRFISHDGKEMTAIGTNDGSLHVVSETYDEVKQMIKDSGIHIHKADPRLDTSHPLTMEDLKEMIGEPVWNSNNGFWYLVNSIQTDPDGSNEKIILRTTKGRIELLFDEDELIKFPLYRMRRGDYERGSGSMSEEEAEVIRKEIVKSAELRQKLGAPSVGGM